MARAEDVTYERITRVYRDESQKKSLTPLEPDFWEKVNRYVAGLHADLAAERAKDPNSKASMLLQDELRKVTQKREQIYQYRERKIAMLASATVGGAGEETRGLTREEQDLLAKLVAVLRANREAALGGGVPPLSEMAVVEPPPAPAAPPPKPAKPVGVLVRILEDVPPVSNGDVTYRLRKEDVVTLPPPIAKVLLDRGKAREITPMP